MLSRDDAAIELWSALGSCRPWVDVPVDLQNTYRVAVDRLLAKGAFDNRPTYEQARDCIFGNSAQDGLDAMVSAGYVQPRREEPDYTEDDVRELASVLFPVSGQMTDVHRVLEAGYRKRTEGGRDG